MVWFFCWLWCGDFYFSNTTVYDAQVNALREGLYFTVTEQGRVRHLSARPFPAAHAREIKNATVLPFLSDFYSLIQERGLGLDAGLNRENHGRIARALRAMGIGALRDPVYPKRGLTAILAENRALFAQQGYLALPGGPAEMFGMVVDLETPLSDLEAGLPPDGPLTLWWTSSGSDRKPMWPHFPQDLKRLIDYFQGKGRKVGCYIQDADPTEIRALATFSFDFYEGLPTEPESLLALDTTAIWIPLAALNDRRYCAQGLEMNLAHARQVGLYDAEELKPIQSRLNGIAARIRERCSIWRKTRRNRLNPISQWAREGRPLGIGSAGGHLFALSGDLRSELALLEALGVEQPHLLKAMFVHNPSLLDLPFRYLREGQPAHFICYQKQKHWVKLIGSQIDLAFWQGSLVQSDVVLK